MAQLELKWTDWEKPPEFDPSSLTRAPIYNSAWAFNLDWQTAIRDDRGRVRLHLARDVFFFGLFNRDQISRAYDLWVQTPEYGKIAVYENGDLKGFRIIKLAKRGNDIYRWKLKNRLSWLKKLQTLEFFNPLDRGMGKKTKALFITLTFDPKLADLKTSWVGKKVEKVHARGKNKGWHYLAHSDGCPCVSCSYNRWITNIRKKFGKVDVFRVWESFESGYPHVHLILIAKDHEFDIVFRDQNGSWRIRSDQRDEVRAGWHSFVDIFALYEIGPRLESYLGKYLLKGAGGSDPSNVVKRIDSDKAQSNMAMLWLFRKQSYAISGDLRQTVHDLMTNGVIQTSQTEIRDFSTYEFKWVGIFTAQELGIAENVWFAWVGPPDESDLYG